MSFHVVTNLVFDEHLQLKLLLLLKAITYKAKRVGTLHQQK